MRNDQLARVEAKIDVLIVQLIGGPYSAEGWLRQFLDEHSDFSWSFYEIRTRYIAWRASQKIPMSDFERSMVPHVINYLLDVLIEEGFIVMKQPYGPKTNYQYKRSPSP